MGALFAPVCSLCQGLIVNPRHPKLVEFIQRNSLQRGLFRLASGKTSNYYIDGKLASFHPEGISLIVEAILGEIRGLEVDAVGGLDMGATPIASAVALRSYQIGHPLPAFTVRKEVKEHGTKKKIEGPLPKGARVVVVDDVVTAGGSILQAIEAVRASGCTVVLATAVVDRNAGAAALLSTANVPYRPLITLAELGVSNAEGQSSGEGSTK